MSLLLLDSRVIRYKKLLIVHIIQSIAKNIFYIIDFPKIIANIILMIDTVNKFEDNIPRIMLLIILLFLFFIFITVSSTKTIVAKIPIIIPRIS